MPLPAMQWNAAQQLQRPSAEQIEQRAPASGHHTLLQQTLLLQQQQLGDAATAHDFDHECDHGDAVAAIDVQLEQLLQVCWC